MEYCGIMKKLIFFSLSILVITIFYPGYSSSIAETASTYQNPRFTLYFGKETKEQITFLSEKQIAKYAFDLLNSTFDEYTNLFGKTPKKKVTLRFLSPSEFKKHTGAPAWTSAMYFNNEITIPLNQKKGINLSELGRALRHEYAHAVIAEISSGKCPAWLDEGIAQYLEGRVNPLLGPALRKWISSNEAMPLSWLQNGFTLLNEDIVPAAYAQSLFSTRKIINDVGFLGIGKYFTLLEDGEKESKSFLEAFRIDQETFTANLSKDMRHWSHTTEINP